jgi:hypothetical protein
VAEVLVTGRRVGKEGGTRALRLFERGFVETSNLLPTFGMHETAPIMRVRACACRNATTALLFAHVSAQLPKRKARI